MSTPKDDVEEAERRWLMMMNEEIEWESPMELAKIDNDGNWDGDFASIGKKTLEHFCSELIERVRVEANDGVKMNLLSLLHRIAVERGDMWSAICQFVHEGLSSSDLSLRKNAIEIIGVCPWSNAKDVILPSILGSDPSLRKSAHEALYGIINALRRIDDESFPIIISILLKLSDMGCCAPPSHEYFDGMAPYDLTLIDPNDCKREETHINAMNILVVLSKSHTNLIPDTLIPEIVSACLQSIASGTKVTDHWESVFPGTYGAHEEMTLRANNELGNILNNIGNEELANIFFPVIESFFKDEDWRRRSAAMLVWSNELLCTEETADLLSDCATIALADECPLVRYIACDLLDSMLYNTYVSDEHRVMKAVSGLVVLATSDPVPRVGAKAIVALSFTREHEWHRRAMSHNYDALLPRLISVLAECPPPKADDKTCFQWHIVEIMYLLVCAVGKDKFLSDLPKVEKAVCPMLIQYAESAPDAYYDLSNVVRLICKLIGEDCEMYRVISSFEEKYPKYQ